MKFKKNKLYIENVSAENIVNKFGSPTYCYSLKKLKENIKKFKNNFKKWNNFVKKSGLKPFDICINYALSQNFDKIIFGINDHKQLKEIVNCRNKKIIIPKNISTNNKFLINPYYWS